MMLQEKAIVINQLGDGSLFPRHFKVDGRVNYALKSRNLLAQVNGFLPPEMGHQLIWNSTWNVTGGTGHNIPLDLQMEHLNQIFKENINTFRFNISEQSISRSSQVIGPIQQLISKFDKANKLKSLSHQVANIFTLVAKDIEIILQTLKTEKVFTYTTRREHVYFSADPFSKLKEDCYMHGNVPRVSIGSTNLESSSH